MNEASTGETRRKVLMAFYPDADWAEAGLKILLAKDVPTDRISLLGRASSSGDNPRGVYYPSGGERMMGCGKMGAFWGGLWGLLMGAAGMFLIPGVGPLLAAGPVVQTLAGAAVTGDAMAGAEAATELPVVIRRVGVPVEQLEETRARLVSGEHLLMLIAATDETEGWNTLLHETGAFPLWAYPYCGLTEEARKG